MYWYWLNNNVSAKGITADLEAMRRAGVGEAFIGHVISDGIPEGTVPILSPSWWQLVEFAVCEGERIGVRVGMFNCPGWSQSGGPWITPEQSMRYLVSAETRVAGGTTFNGEPARHAKAIQEVAVIAYPVPAQDNALARPTRVVCEPEINGLAARLTRTDGTSPVKLPTKPFTLDLYFDAPMPLQTLTLDFGDSPVRLAGTLATVENGTATPLRDISIYRTRLTTAMGPLVAAPFDFSLAPVTARHLRLTVSRLEGAPVLHGCVSPALPALMPLWKSSSAACTPSPCRRWMLFSGRNSRNRLRARLWMPRGLWTSPRASRRTARSPGRHRRATTG